MEGKSPSKSARTEGKFPYDFFTALAKGDDDSAMVCLRAEALPDGEVPSPRAEALMNTGEWDSFQKLSLVYIGNDACAGKIGNDGYRFCGKPRNFCKVGTHTKNTIGKIVRGWYVSCHGKSQGVFASPFLPSVEDGGPIQSSTAARLADEENPFKLTKGQWKFIIESWQALREPQSSEQSPGSSTIIVSPLREGDTPSTNVATIAGSNPFDFTEMTKTLQNVDTNVFTFGEESSTTSEKENPIRSDLTDLITKLKQEIQTLDRKVETMRTVYEARIVTMEESLSAKTRQLENERNATLQTFQSLHQRLQPLEGRLHDNENNDGFEQRDRFEALETAVFGPQGVVENLKLQFSQFKDKVESDGGIVCNGVTFGSKRELLNWYKTKQPPVEIFMDALAYLHGIRSPVVYQEEATRQREAQIKTNMTNQLQVAVFTSFDTIIPAVLVGGKRMTETGGGSIYNWLSSNIKTFEDWKPKGGQTHGVSHTITSGIGRVTDSVNELRVMQTDDPQAVLLSVGMCTDSATFCNELVRFMSDQYEAMVACSIYSEQQIWSMQIQCLQKIVEELSEARGRVAAAAQFDHGYYLWGMLRAWKVQKRFLANNFKDDPALTGIMVRRIIVQGHDTSIKDKVAKFDSLSNKVEEHFRQVMNEIKKLKDSLVDDTDVAETRTVTQLWNDWEFIKENLKVFVVSNDGWCWLLSWMQVGLETVVCIPTSDKAESQLTELLKRDHFKKVVKQANVLNVVQFVNPRKLSIICSHIATSNALEPFTKCTAALWNKQDSMHSLVRLVTISNQTRLQSTTKIILGNNYQWQTIKHHAVGGLSSTRLLIGWAGLPSGSSLKTPKRIQRPLNRFLDPAARLSEWRPSQSDAADCWRPNADDAKPYSLPWNKGPKWVQVYSVYLKATIERHFTEKEICQLHDLRYEWSFLLPQLTQWHNAEPPPLRLFTEFVLMTQTCLDSLIEEELGVERTKRELKQQPDWGRIRAPWLGKDHNEDDQIHKERLLYFGWRWDPADTLDITVACKGDDAEVNLALWAVGGNTDRHEKARQTIRNFLWRIWKRRICSEAMKWLLKTKADKDVRASNEEAIKDCIQRCIGSDWWNWENGSRLFFWRWPPIWLEEARDGSPGFHYKYPRPQRRFPQVPITDEWIVDKDREKLEKLLRRGYIGLGECRTTVPRFPIPKGADDIRVVWDLSKNGLNETMYTPTFFLATMATYLRRIESGFYGGDFDIGEQFHNYMLHPSEQVYCGVEIPEELRTKLTLEGLQIARYMRWKRLVFGWQSSPYLALRMLARALELAKGLPTDPNNAFNWSKVQLNLPGNKDYDPGWPRVMKVTDTGLLASDVVTFYDDGRVFGATEELTIQALRQVTSRLQHYGNQDAARKRRPVSQRPGAWAGGVAYTDQNLLRKFISQEKWTRTKDFLDWIWDCIIKGEGVMERQKFLSGKGFLVHVSLCYDFMQPYLKGFHLSENAWRMNRDSDGWKVIVSSEQEENDDEIDFLLQEQQESFLKELLPDFPCVEQYPPPTVQAVPRLKEDVRILRLFFKPPTPVQVIERPVSGASLVAYGGGDASGEGFGGQLMPLGMQPLLRRGFWCSAKSDESSNWRELRNLVDLIREEVIKGRLVGREIWLATDNSTAANAFFKGASSSKLLHEMVIELRMLALEGNFILRLYHISGTRMIQSGIDGLSRGELMIDSLEKAIHTLMPLNQSPIARSPALIEWLNLWLDPEYKICDPGHWFHEAHQAGEYQKELRSQTWVWDLPPAAAIHALEELGTARLKRHEILRGVVIIPFLLSNEWLRRFIRTVDFYFTIPAGAIAQWPDSMHEPLTVGIYLPLFRWQPWDWKQVPFVVPFGSTVSKMYKTSDPSTGTVLRQFWEASTRISTMPKLYRPTDENGDELCAPGEEKDFLEARPGDHLFVPFECDYCCFYRIKGHVPVVGDAIDNRLLAYIRRANLDAFWSRRPGTIHGLNRLFAEQVEVGESFGFNMFGPLGPFSRNYESGIKAAIGVLYRSQRPGIHEAKLKFSSVRKARALHTDLFNASARGVEGTMVWRSDRARFAATEAPTDSAWFTAFMMGLKARIGERRKQDAAIPIAVMQALQDTLEDDWEDATISGDIERLRSLAEHGAFYLFLYCGSLRGFEGPKIVLTDLRKQIAPPGSTLGNLYGPHIGLPLVGRFKARSQDTRNILIPIAYETSSKLRPGLWTERLIATLEKQGISTGWAFQDAFGEQLKMSHFEDDFYDRLLRIYQTQPDLFTEGVNILEDFHLARSFRRGATTRATAAGVAGTDIDWINRWNIGADASGSGPMRVLYSDRVQLTKVFLRFSLAL